MAEPSDRNPKEDGDEQNEEIDANDYKTPKDAVLFAIDVSNSMLRSLPPSDSRKADQDSATSAALKCAYSLMQQRIISNPNDMMGVLLFGTAKSKFEDDASGGSNGRPPYPHCYLLTDLDRPAAADIKRLRSLVEEESEAKDLLVPSSEPVAMANLLFCANQVFTTKAPNFSSRRLFLVTDNDSPHADSKELRSSAAVRAKDLFDLGVTIELFPISQQDHEFDTSKFYDDIVYRPLSDPEAPAPVAKATKPSASTDGISLLTSLLTSIHSKIVPKRALFSNIPLEFSPDLKISVKGYIIFKRQEPHRSCYVWLDGEKPQIAIGTTNRIEADTSRPVEKKEIRKAFKFGGESILFTPEELSSLRYWGDPVIRIIGFKPQSMLPIWANIRSSTFIYPSEEDYVGSTRTFSALQQTLLRKEKMAVVWYIARKNAAPVFAALLPGAEKLGEYGEQIMPPGMWIIPLPFADDIRSNPEINMDLRAPDVLKDKMRPIIQQLQLPKGIYDPARYPNPALQWHYRVLQSLALDEDMPEKPEDKTIPRYRQIHKRTGTLVQEWGEELQEQFKQWQLQNAGKNIGAKREGSVSANGTAKKSRATPSTNARSLETTLTDEEMRNHVNKYAVGKLNVPVLKEWLSSKRLDTKGKKADLVERVERHFEDKMLID